MAQDIRVTNLVVTSCGDCPHLQKVPRRVEHYCGKVSGVYLEIYSLHSVNAKCPLEKQDGKEISSNLSSRGY